MHTSWASSPASRATMQANRGRDTQPELALRRELHRRGLRFFVNRRPISDFRRTADIVFPRKRVAVFVDGCFWHGCPEHYSRPRANQEFWDRKVAANMARDEETTGRLGSAGWTTIRIWEHVPVSEAVEIVAEALQSR